LYTVSTEFYTVIFPACQAAFSNFAFFITVQKMKPVNFQNNVSVYIIQIPSNYAGHPGGAFSALFRTSPTGLRKITETQL